jgi:hypothetical protein
MRNTYGAKTALFERRSMKFTTKLTSAIAAFALSAGAWAYDPANKAWTDLLQKHVVVSQGGKVSQVRYENFAKDRAQLKTYLDTLSAVKKSDFDGWNKSQQMAFLINVYNAYTVELILAHYPVKSIKDIGSDFFDNRWKRKFFNILGQPTSLDMVEHEMLRAPGRYDEPRVHYAVNCASIGCPMLREEAFTADKLDKQLEEQAARFLSDRSRNRLSKDKTQLEVSKIFDWFKVDWNSGYKGINNVPPIQSREEYFGRYANLFADDEATRAAIKEGKLKISFLSYDWSLNEAKAK